MSTQSGQRNLNELTQQVNSVTVNLTTADQQLNSQSPGPYIEVEADSVPNSECLGYNWTFNFSLPSPNTYYNCQQMLPELFDDDEFYDTEDFRLEPDSMAQTIDMGLNWESSPTPMPSLAVGEGHPNANELPQQFDSHDNSERDVEDGARSFEPDPSQLDHSELASNGLTEKGSEPRLTPVGKAKIQLDKAGTSSEACIGKKRKNRELIILTKEQEAERMIKEKERNMRKIEGDRKYRAKNKMELNQMRWMKPQYYRLMEIASRYGGIDQMESLLLGLQQKEVEHDMFQQLIETGLHPLEQMKSKHGEIDEMQAMLDKFKELEAMTNRLELMKFKYGGIEKMESMLDKFMEMEAESQKLNQIKSKLGIQETESILDKFREMEAELHRFDQIKSSYGGIDEIGPGINRQMVNQKELESFQASSGSGQQMEIDECFRQQQKEADFHRFNQMKSKFGGTDKMEFMLDKFEQMEVEINRLKEIEVQLQDNRKQKKLPFFQESPGGIQEKSGSQSLDLNGDSDNVSYQCAISLNSSTAQSGTTPDIHYSDADVDQLFSRLTDEYNKFNDANNLNLNSIKDLLDEELESVGEYKIPSSLVSTARDILKVRADITKKSKFSSLTVQIIFVLFCAAIKEMGDLSLEEVTEKIIWKLRDPIMDAKRSKFDVEFAMKHLKTIVHGYFGLKARKDRCSLEQKIASLRAEEEALRKELGRKLEEISAVEAKQGDLTSEKCKICQESADKFLGKMGGIFLSTQMASISISCETGGSHESSPL